MGRPPAPHFGGVVSRIAHRDLLRRPKQMPDHEWWQRLDEDFPRQREAFQLPSGDRWRVLASAFTDRAVLGATSVAVGALAFPMGYTPQSVRADFADTSLYARAAHARDPDLFFSPAHGLPTITERPVRFASFMPTGGQVVDLHFDSPFVPVNPRLHARWLAAEGNRRAHARWWRHGDGARAVVAAIHGFGVDDMWLNTWLFQVPLLYQLGYDVLLFTLPFHGVRQSARSPFSGHGFFSGGLSGINEAFAQAVLDFRLFFNVLQERYRVPALGVTGVSLGGHTSALLAAVEPRLAFSMPNVPVASLPDLMLEWHPMSYGVRLLLAQHRKRLTDLRHLLAASSPLSYAPRIDRERLMIIGGVADRIVPPKHARLLWEHWGRCAMHWFPGSHLLHLDRQEYMTETARFFKRIGFSPEGQRAPRPRPSMTTPKAP